jgi:uncharacterized protein YyaL (SSP411 family)
MPHLRKLSASLFVLSAVLVAHAASPKLASSASEFIREQAGSPVDWQLWDETVLRSAKDSGKPVYIFVGSFLNELSRATCRQSFANADTAAFLNKNFICVIVDREERPDIAALAQHYLRTVKQLNNWPAHLWLTPELKPFDGAGYLPPTEEWGKSSLLKIAQQVQASWASDAAGCRSRATEAVASLGPAAPPLSAAAAAPGKTKDRLTAAADARRATFDAAHGGFGDPPKSPEPELLRFLLHQSPADHDAAVATLRAIAGSALRDPLDGGFFHYASDGSWRVPYLQKILTDQARLALAYFDAAQGDDAKAFTAAGQGALDYALMRLLQSDGTFAAAEDGTADEFAGYYVWTDAEIDAALGADAVAFKTAHGVEAAGNVAPDDDLSGKWKGKNFLRASLTPDAKDAAVAARLLAARAARPALPRDDRASAGTHGLLLAALSHAGEPRYLEAAAKLYAAVQRQFLLSPDGELRHQRGSMVPASPADYTALALGCREFARAAKRPEADALATRLLAKAGTKFFDQVSGHYYAVAAELPVGIFARPPAIGEAPAAESLALLAGAPADEAALLTAGLWATVDETAAPAPGDALLALSAQP